jgi:hypothetical protein
MSGRVTSSPDRSAYADDRRTVKPPTPPAAALVASGKKAGKKKPFRQRSLEWVTKKGDQLDVYLEKDNVCGNARRKVVSTRAGHGLENILSPEVELVWRQIATTCEDGTPHIAHVLDEKASRTLSKASATVSTVQAMLTVIACQVFGAAAALGFAGTGLKHLKDGDSDQAAAYFKTGLKHFVLSLFLVVPVLLSFVAGIVAAASMRQIGKLGTPRVAEVVSLAKYKQVPPALTKPAERKAPDSLAPTTIDIG